MFDILNNHLKMRMFMSEVDREQKYPDVEKYGLI